MARFDKHLFISYAHIDNQPLTPEQQGWISRFHLSLEALLSMRLGSKAKIWRDDKLQGNDVFADEIADQFADTAVLVSVLTPRYLNSDWCTKEVAEFCNRAEQNGGIVVENKARIFKVLKAPVDAEETLPPIMKDLLGYEFFTIEDGTPLELDPAYGEKYGQDYNRKVVKLAFDISQLLTKLEANADDTDPEDQGTAKAEVYLAECSYDCKELREILEGELRRHGHTVLPDQRMPRDEDDYVTAVDQLLARCKLSIHLVGNTYGAVPDGPSQKSVTVLQNELAVKRSKSDALRRVVWLPLGTRPEQARQEAFVEALHQDAEAQFGADLITGDPEELKAAVRSALDKIERPQPAPAEAPTGSQNGSRLIYLICDQRDRKATVPVRKFCRAQGFDVSLPAFEGDASAVREAHQQLLSSCDGIMVFYGAGDEAWMHTIGNELRKMPAYRGGKPVLANYTYLAGPKTADKEDLIDMEEPNLIDGLEQFSEAEMAAFVQAMNSARPAA